MNLFIKTIKVGIQDYGSSIKVVLYGKKKDIELQFNSFYNHGATNGDLHWKTKERAIFHSTPEKMLECMTRMAEYKLLDKQYPHSYFFEGDEGEAKASRVAPQLAKAEYDLIPRGESLVSYKKDVHLYEVGDLSADFKDGQSLTGRNGFKRVLKEMASAKDLTALGNEW
jgi:hypothetical protein